MTTGGFGLTDKSCPRRPGFVTDGPILVARRDQSTTDGIRNGSSGQYAIGGHQTRKNGLNGTVGLSLDGWTDRFAR
jgi:hypothetical protein